MKALSCDNCNTKFNVHDDCVVVRCPGCRVEVEAKPGTPPTDASTKGSKRRHSLYYCACVFVLLVFAGQTPAQPRKIVDPKTGQTHFTGRVAPSKEKLAAMAAAAKQRHGNLIQRLPKASAAVYDSRTTGCIPPIRDQASCGSCWDFSGTGMVGVALIKAGQIPNTANQPSEQYTLDCGQNGGCNGDDNTTVLQWAKSTGLPLDQTYGVAYRASSGRCAFTSSMQLLKITDYGFCTSNGDGVASTQDIKNAIATYGCVGCAVAAGGGWWNSGNGVNTGNSTGIDHDVILVGWDDSKGPSGAWIMRNSWGTSWGDKCANTVNPNPTEAGYGWMAYGADSIGTEAVWCVAASAKPPNPWVFSTRAEPARDSVQCCGGGKTYLNTCPCGLDPKLCSCGGPGLCSCKHGGDCDPQRLGASATTIYTGTFHVGQTVPAQKFVAPRILGVDLWGQPDQPIPPGTYTVTMKLTGQQVSKKVKSPLAVSHIALSKAVTGTTAPVRVPLDGVGSLLTITTATRGNHPLDGSNPLGYGSSLVLKQGISGEQIYPIENYGTMVLVGPIDAGMYFLDGTPAQSAKDTNTVTGTVTQAQRGAGNIAAYLRLDDQMLEYWVFPDADVTWNGNPIAPGEIVDRYAMMAGSPVKAQLWPSVERYSGIVKAVFTTIDSTIYRDPQTGQRWRYTDADGNFEYLPEPAPVIQAPLSFGGFGGRACST